MEERKEKKEKTMESKVSDAILQRPEEIKVGGRSYTFYPPSTATLILASEAISRLPQVSMDKEHVAEEVLSVAKDCGALGEVVAILLLGAKHLTEVERVPVSEERGGWWRLLGKKKVVRMEERVVDRKGELARRLLEELAPRELNELATSLLQRMQVADFFAFTTFLIEANVLRARRKVESETTASGPLLPGQ